MHRGFSPLYPLFPGSNRKPASGPARPFTVYVRSRQTPCLPISFRLPGDQSDSEQVTCSVRKTSKIARHALRAFLPSNDDGALLLSPPPPPPRTVSPHIPCSVRAITSELLMLLPSEFRLFASWVYSVRRPGILINQRASQPYTIHPFPTPSQLPQPPHLFLTNTPPRIPLSLIPKIPLPSLLDPRGASPRLPISTSAPPDGMISLLTNYGLHFSHRTR